MRRAALALAALILLSGCCTLSQIAEAHEKRMAMDRMHACGPSTDSRQMDFYSCDYLKAEGNEVRISLRSAYFQGIESVNLSGNEIYSAVYFRKGFGQLEAETYLAGISGIASGNNSFDPGGLGGTPLNCTFTDYSLSGRYLNLTASCSGPIPADSPTTYMLFAYVPIKFSEDAPESYSTLALTDSKYCSRDTCELKLYIIAER